MTAPTQSIPGSTLLITRRTVARFYLFVPGVEMNRIFLYCLAVAAQKWGIVVHAAILLSTHYHLVVTDTRGVHPKFTECLNRLLANATKVLRGWSGEVFNGSGPSVVHLKTVDAIVDKTGYTLSNAVGAGAVRIPSEWPGVVTSVDDMGHRRYVLERPEQYFDPDGKLPASVELRIELPEPVVAEHGEALARQKMKEAVDEHARKGRAECERKGWKFLGANRVRKLSPYKRAKAYEVFGRRNPTFATKGGGMQTFFEAVHETRRFRAEYRSALEQWRAGDRDVVFPAGTWKMRVLHGARCAPFPERAAS